MKTVTIGGVGNVLLGDDGIGPYVARKLEAEYEFADGVAVEDLGTPGLDLIVHMAGVDSLILVDSVDNGEQPGTVTLYRKQDILRNAAPGVRMDPHSPVLSESLLIADFIGDGFHDVLLVGITGTSYEPDQPISEAALRGAELACAAVLEELARIGVWFRRKTQPAPLAVWWEPLGQPCMS